jgi:hypothetical protein
VRKFGVQSQPSDPRLQSLAEQGITADTMTAACEAAKKAKTGSGEALNLGYVISIIKRWSEEAANLRVAGVQAPRAGSKAQAVEQNNRDAVEEAARRIEARERGEQAPQTDPYTIDMEPA